MACPPALLKAPKDSAAFPVPQKNTEVMPVWVYIHLLIALSTAIVPIICQAGLLVQPLLNPVMVAVTDSLSWLLWVPPLTADVLSELCRS